MFKSNATICCFSERVNLVSNPSSGTTCLSHAHASGTAAGGATAHDAQSIVKLTIAKGYNLLIGHRRLSRLVNTGLEIIDMLILTPLRDQPSIVHLGLDEIEQRRQDAIRQSLDDDAQQAHARTLP
jgi:hypothetical protein